MRTAKEGMSKTVYVTKAQQLAAQLIVERSAKSGRPVRPAIANATRRVNGHHVPGSVADRRDKSR